MLSIFIAVLGGFTKWDLVQPIDILPLYGYLWVVSLWHSIVKCKILALLLCIHIMEYYVFYFTHGRMNNNETLTNAKLYPSFKTTIEYIYIIYYSRGIKYIVYVYLYIRVRPR